MNLPSDWNEYDAAVLLLFISACLGRREPTWDAIAPLTYSEAEVNMIFGMFNDLLNIGRLRKSGSNEGFTLLETSNERVQTFLHMNWDSSRSILTASFPGACVLASRHFSQTELFSLSMWMGQVAKADGPESDAQIMLPAAAAKAWGLI